MTETLQELALHTGPGQLGERVLDRGLCSLCGACLAHCPYLMGSRSAAVLVDDCGREHGSCYAVCPVASVLERGAARSADAPLGEVREALWAQAADPALRRAGQHGATVSALLVHALESGAADAALVIGPPASPAFPLLPTARLARTRDEVLEAAGTRYAVRPGAAEANRWLDREAGRLVAVGRPCEIRGIDNRLALRPGEGGAVTLRIGLFCTWALDHDHLAAYLGERLDLAAIRGMEIDPTHLLVTLRDGSAQRFPVDEVRELARPGCRACPDFSAEAADLSVGGTEHEAGWNSLLVRSDAGAAAVAAAEAAGVLSTRPFPEERWAVLREAASGNKRRAEEAIRALG